MFEKQKGNKIEPAATSAMTTAPAATAAGTPASSATRSGALIGSSVQIKGEISGKEDISIEGHVEGTIDFPTHEVLVGKSGQVHANITAKVVKIDGEVEGDVSGNEKVVISRSGKVFGNIVAPRVTLEDGAQFRGSIDMDPGENPASNSAKSVNRSANIAASSESTDAAASSISSRA